MFWRYLLPFWWQIIILFIGIVLQVNASLQLPTIMADIINNGIATGDMDSVWSDGISMIIVTLLGGVGIVIAGYFAARIGAKMAEKMRKDIFETVMKLSTREIDQLSTASLITRTTNDISQVQNSTIMTLRMSAQAPVMAIGAIIMVFRTAPEMSWTILVLILALLALVSVVVVFGLPKFRLIQKLSDKFNLVVRERLTGIRVVRAFSNEKYEEKKFTKVNDDITSANIFVNRLMIIMMPLVQFIISAGIILIIWVSVGPIEEGSLQIGGLMAFIQYAMQVMMAFMFLAMAFIIIPRAIISWKRIVEVLKTKSSIVWGADERKTISNFSGVPEDGEVTSEEARDDGTDERPEKLRNSFSLEMKNVSFSYEGAEEYSLKNISFRAQPGKTTAIIGSIGSGKSTLLNLITRNYDAKQGEVLINSKNVKNYEKDELMKKIGLVPQKSVLFSGTIKENIAFGNPKMPEQEIKKAAKMAKAYDFINKLDKKFESKVSEGGANFSGGQKQRLCIARAIAKNPEIYLFDDSFSALDYKTDRDLRTNLKTVAKNAIVIIVAQRIGTIRNADNILVMNNGKIVGSGTHKKLLKSCRIYREIAESQLSAEEMKKELENGE